MIQDKYTVTSSSSEDCTSTAGSVFFNSLGIATALGIIGMMSAPPLLYVAGYILLPTIAISGTIYSVELLLSGAKKAYETFTDTSNIPDDVNFSEAQPELESTPDFSGVISE